MTIIYLVKYNYLLVGINCSFLILMYHNRFPENLIKGRIAERVFELMFREGADYDVYPLGYEQLRRKFWIILVIPLIFYSRRLIDRI